MANWQFKLDLKDVWKKDDISVDDTAKVVVERIKALIPEIRERAKGLEHFKMHKAFKSVLEDMAGELEDDILPLFEEVVELGENDVELFDSAMYYLYEWADASLDNQWGGKKMCWVSTVI